MKAVVQRVKNSKVSVNNKVISEIGIGFNVNQVEFNKELSDIATSLKKEFNIEFEREEIVAKILENLELIWR